MSKKVKLISVTDVYTDDSGLDIIREGITDWEEITDEEYRFLSSNLYRINYNYRLVVQDDTPVRERITSIKALIDKEQRAIAIHKAKLEEKKLDREKKKLAKKSKTEKEIYEELKAKYENDL